jgi:hypothetical protein
MSVIMDTVNVRFILGEISEEEVEALNDGQTVISKMILPPDDFKLFHYKHGDAIEAETKHGNRIWCTIKHMEILKHEERVITIISLVQRKNDV